MSENQNVNTAAQATDGTRVVHIGAEPTAEPEFAPQVQNPKPQPQQATQQQQRQQPQNNQQVRPTNEGQKFQQKSYGQTRQQTQNNNNSQQYGNSDQGGVTDNMLGLSQTGAIFTVSTDQIRNYFVQYFSHYGYHGIEFANGKMRNGTLPPMFLIFPKTQNLVVSGKNPDQIEIDLMGGKSRGAHYRLDGKLYKLVQPFLMNDDRGLHEASENKNFCYVNLDSSQVFFKLFKESRQYDVFVIDAIADGQTKILYRVAKTYKIANNTNEIEEIVHNLSRA